MIQWELIGQSFVPIVGTEKNNTMIKNIIFDIGNVLAEFAWKDYYKSFGYEQEILDRLAKATTLSPWWNEYDRGVLSDEEVIEGFIANDPQIEYAIRETLTRVPGLVKEFAYSVPWVKELKSQGYQVYYLSNFPRTARADCADNLMFVEYMDGGIFSYEVKLIKPDAAIYQCLLERYGLVAEECVFFDDVEKNIIAARNLGIHGVVFQHKEQAMKELLELTVE